MLSVARVWLARERIELEAAAMFDAIARHLAECGEPSTLVQMATTAADDERDHAVRCRAIVDDLAPGLSPIDPEPLRRMGPRSLSDADRVLYETVAMGCVTESLSCGLLLAMRQQATHPLVSDTIQHILKDEVQHSRLGWAHLAHAAGRRDVSWLASHVAPMLRAALKSDVVPMCTDDRSPSAGVLTHTDSRAIIAETVEKVILPGLEQYGIRPDLTDALG